jgi:uncharacterized protein
MESLGNKKNGAVMKEQKGFIIGGAEGVLVEQLSRMSNRHGLIAGATGTGKTVSLQVLAENFSRLGVPVFAADIKGDLSGLGNAGSPHPKIDERLKKIPLESYRQRPYPVVFWDIFGEQGHPIRSTISEMGPLLLSNLLGLNDTQSGILYSCFKIADDQGLLLLDLKDFVPCWHGWATMQTNFARITAIFQVPALVPFSVNCWFRKSRVPIIFLASLR